MLPPLGATVLATTGAAALDRRVAGGHVRQWGRVGVGRGVAAMGAGISGASHAGLGQRVGGVGSVGRAHGSSLVDAGRRNLGVPDAP
jgi:hypothetical protein